MPPTTIAVSIVIGVKGNPPFEYPGIMQMPDKIKAQPNNKIIWGIINATPKTVTVSLSEFARLGVMIRAEEPLDFPKDRKVKIGAGSARVIHADVKPNANAGLFVYAILIDGQVAQDPELEIERPPVRLSNEF